MLNATMHENTISNPPTWFAWITVVAITNSVIAESPIKESMIAEAELLRRFQHIENSLVQ